MSPRNKANPTQMKFKAGNKKEKTNTRTKTDHEIKNEVVRKRSL